MTQYNNYDRHISKDDRLEYILAFFDHDLEFLFLFETLIMLTDLSVTPIIQSLQFCLLQSIFSRKKSLSIGNNISPIIGGKITSDMSSMR